MVLNQILCCFSLIYLLFISNPSLCQFDPSARSLKKSDKIILQRYGDNIDKKRISEDLFLFKLMKKDSIVSYFCIEESPSKYKMFEFMVIYSVDLEIEKVHILVYREDYGFEIKNRRWLDQFKKRKINDVQSISGATISVESLKLSLQYLNSKVMKEIESSNH